MEQLGYHYTDGGRLEAGFKGRAGDCFTRAVAIATRRPYREVYDMVSAELGKGKSPRDGVPAKIMHKVLVDRLGWFWTPTMSVGSGCRVHLNATDLPRGRMICRLSRHLCAVVDAVVHDDHDPRRGGSRCVYGYWTERYEG